MNTFRSFIYYFRVSQPLLIGRFVRLFSLPSSNDDEESRASQFLEVCLYGGGIVLVSIAYSIIRYPYLFEVMNIGLRARVAMSSLIYRKVCN